MGAELPYQSPACVARRTEYLIERRHEDETRTVYLCGPIDYR